MQTYALDPGRTALTFHVRRLLRTSGAFTRLSGTLVTDDEGAPRSLDVAIAAASLTTGLARRDEHLRSADFLDAERFPVLSYSSQRIERITPNRYVVFGTLRMKGREHPVTLRATLDSGPESEDGLRVRVRGSLSLPAFAIPTSPVLGALMGALAGRQVAVSAGAFLVHSRSAVAAAPPLGSSRN